MEKEKVNRTVDSIRQAMGILEEAVATLKVPVSLAEKVGRIVEKLGLRQTAWKLDVDVGTVCRWWKGRQRPNKKNLAKIEAFYKELFGEE